MQNAASLYYHNLPNGVGTPKTSYSACRPMCRP